MPIKVAFDPGNETSIGEDVDTMELLAYVYVLDMTVNEVLNTYVMCELGADTDLSLFELCKYEVYMSLRMRKPTILVSDQVRHKPACTVREGG